MSEKVKQSWINSSRRYGFLRTLAPATSPSSRSFFTLKFIAFPTSSSLNIMLLDDFLIPNLRSSFSLFYSSNNGNRSNPSNKDNMWKAFRVSGCFPLGSVSSSPSKLWNSISSFVHIILGNDEPERLHNLDDGDLHVGIWVEQLCDEVVSFRGETKGKVENWIWHELE